MTDATLADRVALWDNARTELRAAMLSENRRSTLFLPIVCLLTMLGTSAPYFVPRLAAHLLLGAAVLVANIGIGSVTYAWIRVERARSELNTYSIMATRSDTRPTLVDYEAKVAKLRLARLYISVGALVVLIIGNVCLTLKV